MDRNLPHSLGMARNACHSVLGHAGSALAKICYLLPCCALASPAQASGTRRGPNLSHRSVMVLNASYGLLGHTGSAFAEFWYPNPSHGPVSPARTSDNCRGPKFASLLWNSSKCLPWCPRAHGKCTRGINIPISFPCPGFARMGLWLPL